MGALIERLLTDLLPFSLYGIGSICFLAGTLVVIIRALR